MTSNQLTYWRNQEEERAHRMSEDLNAQKLAEDVRHNMTNEDIARIKNDLEAQGLKIKNSEAILKLVDMYAKYGIDDVNNIPYDVLLDAVQGLGISERDMVYKQDKQEWTKGIREAFKEIGKAWQTILGGGVAKALF